MLASLRLFHIPLTLEPLSVLPKTSLVEVSKYYFIFALWQGKELKMKIEDVVRNWFVSIKEDDDEIPEGFEIITDEETIKKLNESLN